MGGGGGGNEWVGGRCESRGRGGGGGQVHPPMIVEPLKITPNDAVREVCVGQPKTQPTQRPYGSPTTTDNPLSAHKGPPQVRAQYP